MKSRRGSIAVWAMLLLAGAAVAAIIYWYWLQNPVAIHTAVETSQAPVLVASTTPQSTQQSSDWVPVAQLAQGQSSYYEKAGQIYAFYPNGTASGTSSLMSNADPSTFVVSAANIANLYDSYGLFAKDKNNVYYSGIPLQAYDNGTLVPGPDPKTFNLVYDGQGMPTGFAVDSSYVYVLDVGIGDVGLSRVDGADPKTFESLSIGGDSSDSYFKDANHVYIGFPIYSSTGPTTYLLPSADPASFTVLYENADSRSVFGKDKNNVYSGSSIIQGADPATFVSLSSTTPYFKDKNNIYFDGYVVAGADPATFTVLSGNSAYDAEDKNHEYQYGQVVQ